MYMYLCIHICVYTYMCVYIYIYIYDTIDARRRVRAEVRTAEALNRLALYAQSPY